MGDRGGVASTGVKVTILESLLQLSLPPETDTTEYLVMNCPARGRGRYSQGRNVLTKHVNIDTINPTALLTSAPVRAYTKHPLPVNMIILLCSARQRPGFSLAMLALSVMTSGSPQP